MVEIRKILRHKTHSVNVGGCYVGSEHPVVVQSMTNTDTADARATSAQIIELFEAGSEIIRITVNNVNAAKAVPLIRESLLKQNYKIPLVGCFHYNGHKLLADVPECASALDKFRINPGNVGFARKRDLNFEAFINLALKYDKPVRLGVNWGSLDEDLAAQLMDRNANLVNPRNADEVMREAMVLSACLSAQKAEQIGLPANKIILSCKISRVQDLIAVYRELASRTNYPLHVGLTEAGMGTKGIVATTAALSILLQEGIGDTIRASLTPKPGQSRTAEVEACREILQALGLRAFIPQVSACPGCGRTTSTYFQELAEKIQSFIKEKMPEWKQKYTGVENMNVAVMGCIVNGPGESKHANIGISLPGTGESPVAPVFVDGEKVCVLRGDDIAERFQEMLNDYVTNKYSKVKVKA